MMTKKKWLALALFGSLALPACSGEEADLAADAPIPTVLGPNEKADNFRSESAQEYYVRGVTTLTLEPEFADATEEERLERVRELIPYKQVAIGFFLNTYLIESPTTPTTPTTAASRR